MKGKPDPGRGRPITTLSLALAMAALGLLASVGGARAASFSGLRCSGKGPQSPAQEYETASCAVERGKTRTIEGVLRNDKNQPVAGKLMVTFSRWIPQGEGTFGVTPEKTIEVATAANGTFKIPKVTTKSEETVFIEVLGDAESELSTVTEEVDIRRYVSATAKKLGGGRVQVKVEGAEGPFKVSIEQEGYGVGGGAPRKASKAGVATFDPHGAHGTFGIYLDAGELTDLYYVDARPFKL